MERKDLKDWLEKLDPRYMWGDNNLKEERVGVTTEELKIKAMIDAEVLVR